MFDKEIFNRSYQKCLEKFISKQRIVIGLMRTNSTIKSFKGSVNISNEMQEQILKSINLFNKIEWLWNQELSRREKCIFIEYIFNNFSRYENYSKDMWIYYWKTL